MTRYLSMWSLAALEAANEPSLEDDACAPIPRIPPRASVVAQPTTQRDVGTQTDEEPLPIPPRSRVRPKPPTSARRDGTQVSGPDNPAMETRRQAAKRAWLKIKKAAKRAKQR